MNIGLKKGFTLIEMIGVLAIIAILVAAVAPRIFEAIEDSKVTTASTLAKTIQTATVKYYADMGTLQPITNATNNAPNPFFSVAGDDGTGINSSLSAALTRTKTAGQVNGQWTRFRGPYLETFDIDNPPLGTSMQLSSVPAAGAGAAPVATNASNFDLDANNQADVPNGTFVVALVYNDVTVREWEKLEGIIDANQLDGLTLVQRQARGRVKYDAANQVAYIYIAH
jgi:prepilin-type N-terminal cleavage/methylation domain-containing protein